MRAAMLVVMVLLGLSLIVLVSTLIGGVNAVGVAGLFVIFLFGGWLVSARSRWFVSLGRPRPWIIAGLVVLAALLFPTYLLMARAPLASEQPLLFFLRTILFLLPSLALVAAAAMIRAVLLTRPVGREGWLCLALAALLLVKTAHNLYGLLLWDLTDDPLEFIWIVVPALAAFFAGLWLAFSLPGWGRLAGLYALVIPLLLYGLSSAVRGQDFRQVHAKHAEQVVSLLERYKARRGTYPASLSQLVPFDTLSVPGPFIIYGQTWCYDGGEDTYRLGYVDRTHWSDPCVKVELIKVEGQPPGDLPPLCAPQLADLEESVELWCENN